MAVKKGHLSGIYLHSTIDQYIRIYNPTASPRRICVDGIYWGGILHRTPYTYEIQVDVGAYLEIKPASGESIILHNIYFEEQINIRIVSAGNEVDFMDSIGT